MDANFRLKNRLRSNSKVDPGLGTGWAYFVPEEAYREHVLKYATQEEVRRLFLTYEDFLLPLFTDQLLLRVSRTLER